MPVPDGPMPRRMFGKVHHGLEEHLDVRPRRARLTTPVAVLALAAACGAGTSPGPLRESFGGPQPRVLACMPLGTELELTGQAEAVAFPAGSVTGPVTITGLVADVPDGVELVVVAMTEPGRAGELAPQTSFFSGRVEDHLSDFVVERLPTTIDPGEHGLFVSVLLRAGDIDRERMHAVHVTGLQYEMDGRTYTLDLDRRFDVIAASALRADEEFPDCAE